MTKKNNRLANKKYWNNKYCTNVDLKRTIKIHTKINLATTELDKYLKKNLPYNPAYKFIEIGCAPGSWMYYFYSTFGYQPQGLEYSHSGVELTKKNLTTLKLKPIVWEQDLFKNNLKKHSYDVVFSGGFIEHFNNPDESIKKHVELLKKGGYLILEVPNFRGFNYFIQKHIDKSILDKHNTEMMDTAYFSSIKDKFNLKIIDIRYIGKINFAVFGGNKYKLLPFYAIQLLLTIFYQIFRNLPIIDNKNTSPYIIGIYQK